MNKRLRTCIAALITSFLATLTAPCFAQDKPAVPIVVVDLSKVFEQHPQFKQQMDAIKAAVKSSEAEIQTRGKDIESRAKKLQTFKPSSPEYKQLESETARLQAQIQADMALKRKDFLEQEARAYYSTYLQVKEEIKVFAESNRIGLVLRFSSEEIDPTNRQSVLQGVNQPILYNQGGLDITHYIVDRLHRSAGGAQRTAQAPRGAAAAQEQQPRR